VCTGAPPRESGRHGNDRGHASATLPTRRAIRKRGLHLLAVMTSALAQCTPWHRETNHDSTWMGSIRDAVRPSVSQRRGQPCRQPRRGGRWPMGEACTRLCWRRSAIRVRGRWNGSWVRTDGTEWRANPDLLRRVPLSTITRALGPSSSPARSSAARHSSPAQQTGRSWPTPLRYPRFGTQNRPFCHSAYHPDNSAHRHNISIPWSSRCYRNNPRPSHKCWNDSNGVGRGRCSWRRNR
jgi:hypothetical protein